MCIRWWSAQSLDTSGSSLRPKCTTGQIRTTFVLHSGTLARTCYQLVASQRLRTERLLKTKDLVSAEGIEPSTY